MDNHRGMTVQSLLYKYGTMTGIETTSLIFHKFNKFTEFYEWYTTVDRNTRIHIYTDLNTFTGEIVGVDKSSDLIYLYKHFSRDLDIWEMSHLKCSDDEFVQSLTFRVTPYRRQESSDDELKKFCIYSGFDYDLFKKYKTK